MGAPRNLVDTYLETALSSEFGTTTDIRQTPDNEHEISHCTSQYGLSGDIPPQIKKAPGELVLTQSLQEPSLLMLLYTFLFYCV